ncbi:MAG: GNAT family N-acetyltransferase/peptidase C39 family protein [Acidobacteria bacterium]|nr:GNAT family N-acetyltransferase/peptidase C39 family protein [Acidobacteriota bacterium]
MALADAEPSSLVLRPAAPADIPELIRLEYACFDSDRLTARRFHHLITRGHAACLVLDGGTHLAGYILLLFRSGISLARLYSVAVDPRHQGRGLSRRLMTAGEEEARRRECAYIRLEVRPDNTPAIALYKKLGYREFGLFPDYYEDHTAALRMEKWISPAVHPPVTHVPYYAQNSEFTCGPAALMMAMKCIDPGLNLDRRLELRIWREANTVYMTSGHSGCSPPGLALAAWRRGFGVELFLNDDGPFFLDGVRSEDKKEVIRLVHEDFLAEIAETDIAIYFACLTVADLEKTFQSGSVPLVLISSYRIYREKFPHWVVITGFDSRFVFVHDPYVDVMEEKTVTDSYNLPILRHEFERMARYGKSQHQATLILQHRKETP